MCIPDDGQGRLGLMEWERGWEVQHEQRCGGGTSVYLAGAYCVLGAEDLNLRRPSPCPQVARQRCLQTSSGQVLGKGS